MTTRNEQRISRMSCFLGGHEWDRWENIDIPDDPTDWVRTHICKNCGKKEWYVYNETLFKSGYLWSTDPRTVSGKKVSA